MSSMSANESMIRSASGPRSSSSRGRVVVRATIRPAPARLAASNPARASSKITQSAGETPSAAAAEVDLRVGFAARHHVARDRRIEIRPDRTAVEHEIYVGLASRRTHGARNPLPHGAVRATPSALPPGGCPGRIFRGRWLPSRRPAPRGPFSRITSSGITSRMMSSLPMPNPLASSLSSR